MKVIIALAALACFLNCDHGSPISTAESNSPNVSPQSSACETSAGGYQHKSEGQLASMSASQLFDEQVKEQHYHGAIGWGPKDHDDSYAFTIGRHLDKIDPRIIVPILSGVFANFEPKASSDCEMTRFWVASATLSDIDNGRVRVRSFPEGRTAIDALETAVGKLRKAGFDAPDHPKAFLFNLSDHNLQMAKETNIRDEMIRASLETRNRVTMTEAEYIEFSNFLTSLDPTYPTWSEVGDYGPPTLVKDSVRYFESYRKFKTQKN